MDPEKRTLLKVKLEDVPGVDEIFTILMGDEVEPRRNFIQHHALEVRNLGRIANPASSSRKALCIVLSGCSKWSSSEAAGERN